MKAHSGSRRSAVVGRVALVALAWACSGTAEVAEAQPLALADAYIDSKVARMHDPVTNAPAPGLVSGPILPGTSFWYVIKYGWANMSWDEPGGAAGPQGQAGSLVIEDVLPPEIEYLGWVPTDCAAIEPPGPSCQGPRTLKVKITGHLADPLQGDPGCLNSPGGSGEIAIRVQLDPDCTCSTTPVCNLTTKIDAFNGQPGTTVVATETESWPAPTGGNLPSYCVRPDTPAPWTVALVAPCFVPGSTSAVKVCFKTPTTGGYPLTPSSLSVSITGGTIVGVAPLVATTLSVTGLNTASVTVQFLNSFTLSGGLAEYCLLLVQVAWSPTATNPTVNATTAVSTGCHPNSTLNAQTLSLSECVPEPPTLTKGLRHPQHLARNLPDIWPAILAPGCDAVYTLTFTAGSSDVPAGLSIEDQIPPELELLHVTTRIPPNPFGAPIQANLSYRKYFPNGNVSTAFTSGPSFSNGTNVDQDYLWPNSLSNTVAFVAGSQVEAVHWWIGTPIPAGATLTLFLHVKVRTHAYKGDNDTSDPISCTDPKREICNKATARHKPKISPPPPLTVEPESWGPLKAEVCQNVECRPRFHTSKMLLGHVCDGTLKQWQFSGPIQPGDTVWFRVAVCNDGSDPYTVHLQDTLDAGLTFVQGSESYYYGDPGGALSTYLPRCCIGMPCPSSVGSTVATMGALGDLPTGLGMAPATVTGQTLEWTATLPGVCIGPREYLVIDFAATVAGTLLANTELCNTFQIDPDHPNDVQWAHDPAPKKVCFDVGGTARLEVSKRVRRADAGANAPFDGCGASYPPGTQVEYELRITNSDGAAITGLCVLDVLPHLGDISILPAAGPQYVAGGSDIDLAASEVTVVNPGWSAVPNAGGNPRNPSRSVCGFCQMPEPGALGVGGPAGAGAHQPFVAGIPTASFSSGPTTWPNVFSFQITGDAGNPSSTLASGASIVVRVKATIPANAAAGQLACNHVAASGTSSATGMCLRAEASCCLSVQPPPGTCCCDEVKVLLAPPSSGASCRHVSIVNTLSAPICAVYVTLAPAAGASLAVNNLLVNGTPPTGANVVASSSGATIHLPANLGAGTVDFDLCLPFGPWSGNVWLQYLTCDEKWCRICGPHPWSTARPGPWEPEGSDIFDRRAPIPEAGGLRVYRLAFSRERLAGRGVRSVGLLHDAGVEAVYAVTGVERLRSGRTTGQALVSAVRIAGAQAVVELAVPLDAAAVPGDPALTVFYLGRPSRCVGVTVVYYDAHGKELARNRSLVPSGPVSR